MSYAFIYLFKSALLFTSTLIMLPKCRFFCHTFIMVFLEVHVYQYLIHVHTCFVFVFYWQLFTCLWDSLVSFYSTSSQLVNVKLVFFLQKIIVPCRLHVFMLHVIYSPRFLLFWSQVPWWCLMFSPSQVRLFTFHACILVNYFLCICFLFQFCSQVPCDILMASISW